MSNNKTVQRRKPVRLTVRDNPNPLVDERISDANNKMPDGQGKRNITRPRHDLIPLVFLDEIASIFEEGLMKGYGDSWKDGGTEFLTDCLNHASNHLHKYMDADYSENHLAKAAWNCLAVLWHDRRGEGLWKVREGHQNDYSSDGRSTAALKPY